MDHDFCHPRAHLRVGRILESQDRMLLLNTNDNQSEKWWLLDALIGEKFPEREMPDLPSYLTLDRHLKPLFYMQGFDWLTLHNSYA